MSYLFTSESVSEGHPDKVADRISDALLDNFLAWDPDSKVACETLVTTGQVVVAGEVRTKTYLDIQSIIREVINKIGYTRAEYMFDGNSCGIFSAIHEQSPDIAMGVERANREEQGAGDQGMMFGYAVDESKNYLPLTLDIAHEIVYQLAEIRREGKVMKYLRPDSKSQVTVEYNNDGTPLKVHTIVVSTQHDDFDSDEKKMLETIRRDVIEILIPRVKARFSKEEQKLFGDDIIYHVNPTGKFVIGGPHGDSGLTGRKIIVDTYGGRGAHGGGAFSGKDPSKVDRSAAYAARHIAKNMVAAGVAREMLLQISYAIGVARPVGIFVNTFGTSRVKQSDGEIAKIISEMFDLRPASIEKEYGLRKPIYEETAAYGHMGRDPRTVEKRYRSFNGLPDKTMKVDLFKWEELNKVDEIRKRFGI